MREHHILKKFVALALPFALLFAWFFAFEPYDWFCVKGESWYACKAISSKRQLLTQQPENIILGDSHMANLNTDYIASAGGGDWAMLAYGGATLYEAIQDFWYAAAHTKLKNVVFGVNFYSMNYYHRSELRHAVAVENAENLWSFVSDFRHWEEARQNCAAKLYDLIADRTGDDSIRVHFDDPSSLTQDTRPGTEVDESGYRTDLLGYVGYILPVAQQYSCYEYCEALGEIIDYCDANGISITFCIFNSNRVIWEQVITPLGLRGQMDYYKDFLKRRAAVYDMEFYNDYAMDDDRFLDGFHVTLEEKLRLARIFFGGEQSPYCTYTTPDTYEPG